MAKAMIDSPFWRGCISASILAVIMIVGFPLAYIWMHGESPSAWPDQVEMNPGTWISDIFSANVLPILITYWEMGHGTCDSLAGGGRPAAVALSTIALVLVSWSMASGRREPPRDASGAYGSTNWATRKERRKLARGVEIGLDPEDRRPVRIEVEKNLLTIAPPRTGKTAGFIIPNLAVADRRAWSGPAVVIDPKGDAYRAVRRRRRELGHTVRCLDPLGLVGGEDRWNPLLARDPDDILYLQGMARALLPSAAGTENGAFFTNTAVDLIVAAFTATVIRGRATPTGAAKLLQNPDQLIEALEGRTDPVAEKALNLLRGDPKLRDNVVTTTQQATQWLSDARMRRIVDGHTFELSDLARGDVDLFIVLPADSRKEALAPFVRWLLADLFAAARANRMERRLLVIIDEAKVLGRFDAVIDGQGELPGYGVSIWTIWQARSQLTDTYGADGVRTFLQNAEMINVFDIPRQDPDETEYWSRAIGEFTGVKATTSNDSKTGRPTTSVAPEAQRLVPATDIPNFLSNHQVAFLSGQGHTRNPLKLRRTRAFQDPRFAGLIDPNPPVLRG
jgi:type IV secretion system protein VirD4